MKKYYYRLGGKRVITINRDNTMTLPKDNSGEFVIALTIEDPDDSSKLLPYILQEGERVIFTIKSKFADEKLIEKVFTEDDCNENGELTVVLTCQDTAHLRIGAYVYDVAFQPPGTNMFDTFIKLTDFNVVRRVSEVIRDG